MHLLTLMLYILVLLTVIANTTKEARKKSCKSKLRDLRKRVEKLESCGCPKRKYECPVGYIRHKSSCYWFVMGETHMKTWSAAQDFCRTHGGNLVTVSDRRRERFIRNYFMNNFEHIDPSTKLYTGLILTDISAKRPFSPHYTDFSPTSMSGERWTATKEAVVHENSKHQPVEPLAKWTPNITGHWAGPNGKFLSCVVILIDPKNKRVLTWRYNPCEEHLNFICEVRLRESKKNRPRRPKRSSSFLDVAESDWAVDVDNDSHDETLDMLHEEDEEEFFHEEEEDEEDFFDDDDDDEYDDNDDDDDDS